MSRLARALALILGATVLTLVPASAHAAAGDDPRPVAAGADWLAGQLDGAGQSGDFYLRSYDASLDAAFALDAVGGHEPDVQAVADTLDAQGDYYFYDQTGRTHLYAGRVARVLHLAQVAGRDGRDFAGRDVVALLEGRVLTDGAVAGRIRDDYGPRDSDYADVAGQGYAVRSLAAAGSGRADAALDYLLAQQCSAGYFRSSFAAADSPDQSCADGTDGTGRDPDAGLTALTVLNLADLAASGDEPRARTAVERAVAWLVSVQAADGSFRGVEDLSSRRSDLVVPNAGSTGLAGWALGAHGRPDRARSAATWVRARQADDPAACGSSLAGETGGVAPDDAALMTGRREGLATAYDERLARFVRATAYALPALSYAPASPGTPVVTSSGAPFRRAGSRETVAAGFASGQAVCVVGPDGRSIVSAVGAASGSVEVTLPRRTTTASYDVSTTSAAVGRSTYRVLAATKPKIDYRRRPVRGTRQRVAVSGLVSGESVVVLAGGVRKARGTVDARGRFAARFVVRKRGRVGLTVRGEFPDRRASRSYLVVRRH